MPTGNITTEAGYPDVNQRLAKGDLGFRHQCFGLLAVVVIATAWGGLTALFRFSFGAEQYSYIVLIPAISAVLMIRDSSRIFTECQWSPWIGGVLLLAGTATRVFLGKGAGPGSTTGLSVTALSVVLLLLGSFTLCYGARALWLARFPLMFLMLLVPIPPTMLESATLLLQRASCQLTYAIMTLSGAPVLRQGFVLVLPNGSIEVAQQCSGINSTLGLLIGSLVACHLFLHSAWKKILVAAMVVPVSIFKNALRINTLYWLGTHTNQAFLTGELHRYGGLPFSVVAIGILGPLVWALRRTETALGGQGIRVPLYAAGRRRGDPAVAALGRGPVIQGNTSKA